MANSQYHWDGTVQIIVGQFQLYEKCWVPNRRQGTLILQLQGCDPLKSVTACNPFHWQKCRESFHELRTPFGASTTEFLKARNSSLSVSFPKVGVLECDSNLNELIQMTRLTSKNDHCNLKLKIDISINGRLDCLIRIRTVSCLFKMNACLTLNWGKTQQAIQMYSSNDLNLWTWVKF